MSVANEVFGSITKIEPSAILKSVMSRQSFCFLSFETPCEKLEDVWFCHAGDSELIREDQRRCISTRTIKFHTDPSIWTQNLSDNDSCIETLSTVFSEKARDTSWRLNSFLSLGVGVAIMLCIWLIWEETPKHDNDLEETFLSHNI